MNGEKEITQQKIPWVLLREIAAKMDIHGNTSNMKKLILICLTFTLTAAVASSCKSHERCAAYGTAN